MEKKVELSDIKERTAYACLEKVAKNFDKLQLEKEAYENLVNLVKNYLLTVIDL